MNLKDISVVVQGAIIRKITQKCLKSLRKYLDGAEIILSTWEGTDISNLDYDILILNRDPGGIKHDFTINKESSSINNFNRQLVSTQNGIKKSSRKYILKLRTDLILTGTNFINYWCKFNCRVKENILFNHRVLCSSIYSRENSCLITGNGFPTPFHPSDFWLFGESEDLKNYFLSSSLQTKKEGGNWNYKYTNRLPYSSMLWKYAPEQQFCVNWVKKYYPNLQFEDWSDWNYENIKLSNNILYNNFIFLDYEQSSIYSVKHAWAIENKNKIEGLITYKRFQKRYKEYCDSNYIVKKSLKDFQFNLKTHFKRLIVPLFKFKSWIFVKIYSKKYKNF